MNDKKCFVTLDTEMDADAHWGKKWPPEYSSITEGIPKFYRPLWDKYNVHPIYFVSPDVLYDERSCEVLKSEISKGAIIGAHLHGEYIEPDSFFGKDMATTEVPFPCFAYDRKTEYEKLKNLKALIKDKLGVSPEWYRAARFGADAESFEILSELGFKYDSSVTPMINWSSKGGPDHSKESAAEHSVCDGRIYEYPVTIFGKRWGMLGRLLPENWLFYRWLRPTHMTYIEMKHIIKKCIKEGIDHPVMMLHSMEIMVNKTPYVRNKFMQKYYLYRMDKIISYAKKKGFEV